MKKIILVILALVIVGGCFVSAFAFADTNLSTAKSALLMEYETGEVLYEKNATDARPIASMVKIMTLLCIYDAIEEGKITLDETVTVSQRSGSMGGSQAFLDVGSQHKVDDLIKTIIICSANDSCVAMAEHIAGSVENFVEIMNKKAENLQLKNTYFVNCTGLPAINQFSCAIDVATMFREMIKYENFFRHSKIWMEDYVHPDGRITGLTNTNKLVRFYDGCDGGKTGFTNEAKHCLCATAKRGQSRYIAVVIGADDSKTRFAEVSGMFNYAFANYEAKVLLDTSTGIDGIDVRCSKDTVTGYAKDNLVIFGKKGKNTVDYQIEIFDDITAPLSKGDIIGEAYYILGDDKVKVDIVVNQDIEQKSFWDYVLDIVGQ